MAGRIWDFLSDEGFQPHGFCLLWRPDVFWLHVVSDILIAASYLTIPIALVFFARRRRDIVYVWVLYLFGAFIVACGVTHLLGIWTMWVPDYAIQGVVKAMTGVVSMATAVVLWPLMPRLLAIPSRADLEAANRDLQLEVNERRAVQDALQNASEQLRKALHDSLTGVVGRSLLYDTWDKANARAVREARAVGLLMIDLDGFKAINDELGHAAGDAVLREVAKRLSACIRGSDTVARIGGDEFVVLLQAIRCASEAEPLVGKINQVLERPIEIGADQITVGASIGVAASRIGEYEELQDVLNRADKDMYDHKCPDRAPRYRCRGDRFGWTTRKLRSA